MCVLIAIGGCKERERSEVAKPPSVVVARPASQKITHYLETTGSVEAVNSVDLVARVAGIVQEQSYRDGQEVQRGANLFLIEPAPYWAQLQQAQAQQQAAEAHLAASAAEYKRQAELAHNQYSAQSALDQARATRDSDQASVAQTRAAAQAAAITYSYTRVTAPFDGIASAHLVSVGNLVGGNGKLASVVQLDPIHVTFTISEQDAQRIRARLAQRGATVADLGTVTVEAGLQTEAGYPHRGQLDYINPGVDAATGTLSLRAVFANPDRTLLPGSFVRVRLPQERDVPALLVPDTALGTDQGGDYVLVVDPQDTVQQRHVVRGALVGDQREVTGGLEAADRIVIAGLQRAVPGERVQPTVAAP